MSIRSAIRNPQSATGIVGAAAEAIVSLLMDPGRAHAMGEAGRKRVLERFTWERMATEARRMFGEAVEK